MPSTEPDTELDPRFSGPDATPTPWAQARHKLETAELFWLTTVRPDGRPHVTPLLCVWDDGAAYFCTGATERKARNLDTNPHCILTTGSNALNEGLDLVLEGDARRLVDNTRLSDIAAAYEAKYGAGWHWEVRDGGFVGAGDNHATVYEVIPSTVFGFGKGAFSQTRWRFPGG